VELCFDAGEALACDADGTAPTRGVRAERGGELFVDVEEFPDFLEREAELLGLLNEAQAFKVRCVIGPIAGSAARRRRETTFALVEAQGLDGDASLAGNFSDAHGAFFSPIPRICCCFGRAVELFATV
jgi:hypothetical protein